LLCFCLSQSDLLPRPRCRHVCVPKRLPPQVETSRSYAGYDADCRVGHHGRIIACADMRLPGRRRVLSSSLWVACSLYRRYMGR
jgi:hypothetical protein